METVRIGTAGWSIPLAQADHFPGEGQHLERYARVLHCAEIDSSFYRRHRFETYKRWAAQTPADFRFAVKLPRAITHAARLREVDAALASFLGEVAGLGERLGVLLVQLPPSLAFEAAVAKPFFGALTQGDLGHIVVEARHASWFTAVADELLVDAHISRAEADPAPNEAARQPGGWLGPAGDGRGAVLYHRWHGSPRIYWSAYGEEWLQARAAEIRRDWPAGCDHWCIFDNTAAGHALPNAMRLQSLLAG